jgi:hypothetical protein
MASAIGSAATVTGTVALCRRQLLLALPFAVVAAGCADHHVLTEPRPDAGTAPAAGYPSCLTHFPIVPASCYGEDRTRAREGDIITESVDYVLADGSGTVAGCACLFECTDVPCPGPGPGGVMPSCVDTGGRNTCFFLCESDADCPDAWRCVDSKGHFGKYCIEVTE